MKQDQGIVQVLEIADGVLRSWWTVVAGVCLGLAAGLVALHRMTPIYEANIKIFAAEKLPRQYIRPTVTDDTEMRLQALREAVLSRPYLLDLIQETYSLPRDPEDQESLMRSIRGRVQVIYTPGARHFEIRFQDADPQRAAQVANRLGERYMKENVRQRATQAGEVTKSLGNLAENYLDDLRRKEKEIADFKARHPHEIKEQNESNLQFLRGRQNELDANLKAQAAAETRIQSYRAQQAQEELLESMASSGGAAPTQQHRGGNRSRLKTLQGELEALRLKYSEDHPDVVAKKRQIADLEAAPPPAENEPETAAAKPASPYSSYWGTQIAADQRELIRLKTEERRIRADVAVYEGYINNTPRIQAQLDELTSGVDILRDKYREFQGNAASARGAQMVEEEQQGMQFEIIDPAVAPRWPIWPKRLPILGLGVAMGLVVFVGPLVLRRLLQPIVGSEAGLRLASEAEVLVGIPALPTAETARLARGARLRNFGLSVASVAILVVAAFATRA
ncbi:MAG TPA: hypothetical protein VJS92_08850 [Candidatus Polarisedimenticolaceae bacterium]|nr:hypothetical protein [Candidatus Polarisedimenticolaceae bacterium]